MGITTVLNQFRELTTLELHPSQSYVSSSQEISAQKWGPGFTGITGSVSLVARPSKNFKNFPDVGVVISDTDTPDAFVEEFEHGPYFFADAIKNMYSGRVIPEGADISLFFSPPHWFSSMSPDAGGLFPDIHNLSQEKKNNKKLKIRRFRPPYKYSRQVGGPGSPSDQKHLSGTDLGIKLYIKGTLMPANKMRYTNSQMAYTNYNVLNFFTASHVPSDSVLIYPNFTASMHKVGPYDVNAPSESDTGPGPYYYSFGARLFNCLPFLTPGFSVASDGLTAKCGSAPYTPSGSFSISFYINPRHTVRGPTGRDASEQSIGGNPFTAGTILHVSSSFAISLVSGSAVSNDGNLDGFRIMLQLSQSADIEPRSITYKTGSSRPITKTYPRDLIFLSDDNSLRYNRWHHVAIRWGGRIQNNGSGSIMIDGAQRGTFHIHSNSITPQLQLEPLAGMTPPLVTPAHWRRASNSVTDPDALFVGNYYTGRNKSDASGDDRILRFFNVDAFWREGLSDTPLGAYRKVNRWYYCSLGNRL